VGYFAQSAFPASLEDRMSCVGNKNNAEDIVNYQFLYNERASEKAGSLLPLTQAAIDSHQWDATNHVLLDKGIAYSYLEKLQDRLPAYAQSTTDPERSATATALTKLMGDSPIAVEDNTGKFWPDSGISITPTAFVDRLRSAGFQRFGCMAQRPTVGDGNFDAVILAIPLNPAEKPKGNTSAQYSLCLTGLGWPDCIQSRVQGRVSFSLYGSC
jgi:hypothetical protein